LAIVSDGVPAHCAHKQGRGPPGPLAGFAGYAQPKAELEAIRSRNNQRSPHSCQDCRSINMGFTAAAPVAMLGSSAGKLTCRRGVNTVNTNRIMAKKSTKSKKPAKSAKPVKKTASKKK
jgi:hypothetical protein